MNKIRQSVRFLGPLLKTGVPLTGNVFKSLAKNVLMLLGIAAAASVADTATHKKIFGSGVHSSDLALRTTSNEEMNGNMKIVRLLEESGLLIKGICQTVKNESKEEKEDLLVCYLIH